MEGKVIMHLQIRRGFKSEDPTLLLFKLVSILLKSWYKFHDCVHLCMFFFIIIN